MPDVSDQLRQWSTSLAAAVEPVDIDRITTPTDASAGTSTGHRWLAVAASAVVIAGGIFAVATFGNEGPGRIGPVTDPPRTSETETTTDATTDTVPPTTAQSLPSETTSAEGLGGIRFPVEADEQDAEWVIPWDAGFLAGTVERPEDGAGETTVSARFTLDGASWDSVEMSMPPGLQYPARVLSVGDRFIMVGAPESSADADIIRVASTTDLLDWSTQDFEVPGPRPRSDVGELGGSFTSMGSFAANETGWTMEVRRIYSQDVAAALPGDAREQIDDGAEYRIRSDDAGFSVAVNGPDGAAATPDSTYEYTWDEVGIASEAVPFMTGEIPASRTWAASWDGSPAVANGLLQGGPTLASRAGFVRWNDQTWFSADGLSWSGSPLPDPNGTLQSAFTVSGGFVAIVVGVDGTSEVYRLDERGRDPMPIEVEGLPDRFAMNFAGASLPDYLSLGTSAAVLDAGLSGGSAGAPVIIDADGYRFQMREQVVSVIDLGTGETVLTMTPVNGPPAADTFVEFTESSVIVTDPETETVLMEFPIETLLEAQEALSVTTLDEPNTEPGTDLQLLASTDGERFQLEDLRPSSPDFDAETSMIRAATNDQVALVRFGDEWIWFDLAP